MRTDRQAGITILQLLLAALSVWGFFTFARQRYLPALNLPVLSGSQGVDSQAYFTRVLQGIEKAGRRCRGASYPWPRAAPP